MYKIEFVKNDGETISFDNVVKIQYGKNSERLSTIEEHKILNDFFPQDGYFHLTSENLSISYHDENTVYVVIKKLGV